MNRDKAVRIVTCALLLVVSFRAALFSEVKGLAVAASFAGLVMLLSLKSNAIGGSRIFASVFCALFAWILLGTVTYPIEAHRFFLGLWYTFSALSLYFAFSRLRFTFHAFTKLVSLFAWILAIVALIGVLQALFTERPDTDFLRSAVFLRGYRSTLDTPVIFYASLAFLMSALLCLSLIRRSTLLAWGAGLVTILILATGSRKLALATVLIWIFYVSCVGGSRAKSVITLAALGLISSGILFFYQNEFIERFAALNVYFADGASFEIARNALYYYGVVSAYEHFPFGAGLGMYGSAPAAIYYSPLYSKYGLNYVHGMQEDSVGSGSNYLMDAFWPQIVGELGFIGSAAFLFLLFFPLVSVILLKSKVPNTKTSDYAAARFLIVCLYIIFVIESVGSPLLTNPLGVLIFGALAGACWSMSHQASRS